MQRETFRRLDLRSTGFGINAEIASRARQAGLTIVEMPVRHRRRRAGRSTIGPSHVLAALPALARVRTRGRSAPGAAGASYGASLTGSPAGSVRLERSSTPRPAGRRSGDGTIEECTSRGPQRPR